mmetsp:Transcript_15601/g.44390  ORF Transcript_15601/g.44390 Transcript_15601/m.44390 type:complete len:352 (-) Transcript_15601:1203-2258(-)
MIFKVVRETSKHAGVCPPALRQARQRCAGGFCEGIAKRRSGAPPEVILAPPETQRRSHYEGGPLVHLQERTGPTQDRPIGRDFRHGASHIHAYLLRFVQVLSTELQGAIRGEVLVLGHLSLRAGALRGADLLACEDGAVLIKVVLVSGECGNDIEGLTDVSVQVAELVIVVAAVIILHPIATIDKEIVVGLVVTAAIIIVNGLLWRIVVDEEVVVNLAPLHDQRRRAGAHSRDVWLPVPRVEWPMVAGLPTCRKHQVVAQFIAAAKAVVVVDASAGAIEKDITRNCALSRFRLHVETALLLVQANLARQIPDDLVVPRVVAVSAVNTCVGEVRARCVVRIAGIGRLVRVAP